MSATCSLAVRPLVHDDSDEHASRVLMTRPLVSPYRRECRSAGQALDARGPLCLFRENLRALFWSRFRRKTRWLCVRRKRVHRRRDRATIGRRSRCGKSRAGDRTSRPPRNQPTATRLRSLPAATPQDSFSKLAGVRTAFGARTHHGQAAPVQAPARAQTVTYSFAAGGFGSGAGAGAAGSAAGVVPRSSDDAAAQSPAQSLVPLTVPTSLQPIGANGFTCFNGLPPTLGAPV